MLLRTAILVSLLAAGCASAPPPAPPPKAPAGATPIVGAGSILYAWTQIVPGPALARAVLEGPDQPCPEIRLDDLPGVAMTPNRASLDAITLCEHPLVLPGGGPVSRAQVADRLLPLPALPALPADIPERIAVIGDGGGEWPLAQIAKTVARRQSPTLAVYVGESGCGESDWTSQRERFFQPVDELLQVAPWLVPGSCGPILAPAAEETASALPASALVRVYRDLLEAAGAQGFLMLVRDPDAGTWRATFSSPKGDETRTCRLLGGAFECT